MLGCRLLRTVAARRLDDWGLWYTPMRHKINTSIPTRNPLPPEKCPYNAHFLARLEVRPLHVEPIGLQKQYRGWGGGGLALVVVFSIFV